ncbi:MAG TPA: DUF4214 domain-containing protein [Ramlibacter sp.]|jgi:hypothetical protein
MPDYEFTGAKWGSSGLGTSGGQVSWSFARIATNFYSFDAPISQVSYQELIRKAFQAWEAVANIDFVEVADSAGTMIRLGWDAIDGRYNTIGEATYTSWYGSEFNQLSRAEIRFDTAETWSTTNHYVAGSLNFFAVAVHEIGHALGLAHTDAQDTIMFSTIGTLVSLSAGDIAGAQALYGSNPALTPAASEVFSGTDSHDVYVGTASGETIVGYGGNDRLTGAGGNDRIEGGVGTDTAAFSGKRDQFGVSVEGTSELHVEDLRTGSPEGIDTLTSVERLSFTDGTLAFDFNGSAGQAYRLYQAAFDRTPDIAGLGYWIKQLDAGKGDLTWAAHQFQHSQEFQHTYGSPADVSDAQFLALLYNNVLDREPDAAGYSYWSGRLDHGLGRDTLLASFSESKENVDNVAAAISDGIWYI